MYCLCALVQSAESNITITVNLTGFPSGAPSLHGFHVHENADLANSCGAAGGHYNPEDVTHGGPADEIRSVHAAVQLPGV